MECFKNYNTYLTHMYRDLKIYKAGLTQHKAKKVRIQNYTNKKFEVKNEVQSQNKKLLVPYSF